MKKFLIGASLCAVLGLSLLLTPSVTQAQTVKIYYPSAGETVYAGTTYNMDIEYKPSITSISVYLVTSGSPSLPPRFLKTLDSNSVVYPYSYKLNIPSDVPAGSNYQLKLIEVGSGKSYTSGIFKVAPQPIPDPQVTITSPNSGEISSPISLYFTETNVMPIGSVSATDSPYNRYYLYNVKARYYYPDGVKTMDYNLGDRVVINNNTRAVYVSAAGLPLGKYKIILGPTSYTATTDFQEDITDGFINHVPGNAPKVTLTTLNNPNVVETWTPGEQRTITWTSNGIAKVKIQLFKNGILNRVIAKDLIVTGQDGSYTWTVPGDLKIGAKYKLRIVSSTGSPANTSLSHFTIISGMKETGTNDATVSPTATDVLSPVITSLSKSSGAAGSAITIYGSDLGVYTTIEFNGQIFATYGTGSQAPFTVPASTPVGAYDVTVINPNTGERSNAVSFVVTYPSATPSPSSTPSPSPSSSSYSTTATGSSSSLAAIFEALELYFDAVFK